jgi:ferredoxin, 2Fe-2S
MARVRFVHRDGVEKNVDVGQDVSVMMAAVRSGIRGIDGECGGCLDCATCHVYVEESQAALVPPPGADESELLSSVAAQRRPNSRLSCQLKVPCSIDELIVYIPESQS